MRYNPGDFDIPTEITPEARQAALDCFARIDRARYDGNDPTACIVGFPTDHELQRAYLIWLKDHAAQHQERKRGTVISSRVLFMAHYLRLPVEPLQMIFDSAAHAPYGEDLDAGREMARKVLGGEMFRYRRAVAYNSDAGRAILDDLGVDQDAAELRWSPDVILLSRSDAGWLPSEASFTMPPEADFEALYVDPLTHKVDVRIMSGLIVDAEDDDEYWVSLDSLASVGADLV